MLDGLKAYPEYKDIGQPWVGAVPAHWRTERGKRLFIRMRRPARDEDQTVTCFRDGVVTLRKNRRLRGFTEALKEIGYQGVRVGDLVIHAMDAFAGAIGVSDSDGKGSPVYQVCQPREDANAKYYAFLVREMSRSQWIMALAKGIRERSTDFRFETFGGQFLPVPPPAEQAGIVRFLGAVDRKVNRFIRAKRRLIEVLTEQKQAIITHAVTKGLNPYAPLKPSGIDWLGDVPEHWEVVPIRRRCAVIDCKHVTVEFVEDGIPLASVREVQTFDLSLGKAKRTTSDWYEKLIEGDRRPRRGDIIYCRNVSVGAAAIVNTDDPCAMGQDVCLIRSKENPRYINYFLHSALMDRQLSMVLVGSTFDRINVAEVKALTVVFPPKKEQDAIAAHLDGAMQSFEAAIAVIKREIDLIREYRTRLVADVVTGKVDVRATAEAISDESPPSEAVAKTECPADSREDGDAGEDGDDAAISAATVEESEA